MTIASSLQQRSGSKCELCGSEINLTVYEIPPLETADADHAIMVCEVCHEQINDPDKINVNHWHCLNDSMWSQVPAVQVMAWRMLTRLSSEVWAQDLLDMLYLDDETRRWAEAGAAAGADATPPTLDSNGNVLENGDTVTLIKDLDVKGANFTAKRGTAVRNISLTNNPEQIEGRVNGVRIVLLTQYLKKSN